MWIIWRERRMPSGAGTLRPQCHVIYGLRSLWWTDPTVSVLERIRRWRIYHMRWLVSKHLQRLSSNFFLIWSKWILWITCDGDEIVLEDFMKGLFTTLLLAYQKIVDESFASFLIEKHVASALQTTERRERSGKFHMRWHMKPFLND